MSDTSQENIPSQLSTFFDSGSIFDASEEDLKNVLRLLNKQYAIPNEMVRHTALIRGITVNTLLNMRLVQRIDALNTKVTEENRWLGRIVTVLTVVSTVAAVIQIIIALR